MYLDYEFMNMKRVPSLGKGRWIDAWHQDGRDGFTFSVDRLSMSF
ncbi:hypothetical protein [Flagellimonas sp. 2504JD1-5]